MGRVGNVDSKVADTSLVAAAVVAVGLVERVEAVVDVGGSLERVIPVCLE